MFPSSILKHVIYKTDYEISLEYAVVSRIYETRLKVQLIKNYKEMFLRVSNSVDYNSYWEADGYIVRQITVSYETRRLNAVHHCTCRMVDDSRW